jgi:hypothetical protein
VYFSVTERQNAKRCPRLHRLSSKAGRHLGLIIPPVYLSTGSLIHKGSQLWLLDQSQSYESWVMVAASQLLEKVDARYLKQVGAPISEEEKQPLWDAIDFARVMARNYQTMWGSPLPEGFTLIRPEQRAIVPVPGTEHPCETCWGYSAERDWRTTLCNECKGDPDYVAYHYLDGRFDGLIQDAAGRIHILEHKTYNSRPSEEGLAHNDQFLTYMWLAIQLNIGDVAGIAYDGLWRRTEVPKSRTFQDLFLRRTILRTRSELLELQRMLPNELNFMARQIAAPEDPWINRRWQGCYDCSFADKVTRSTSRTGLCTAISRNENVAGVLNLYYTERDDDIDEETEEEDAT